MSRYYWLIISLVTFCYCSPDEQAFPHSQNLDSQKLTYHINHNVVNAEQEEEQLIIALWREYLESREFQRRDGRHWSYEQSAVPDQFLWSIQQFLNSSSEEKMQNTIIGVFPVDHNHYALKSMFSVVDDQNLEVSLRFIITVYAKKINGYYTLVNSTDYHRLIWEKKTAGNITYYIHPTHDFDETQASKMNEFSKNIAKQYVMAPLEFDYFVANNTRDIATMMGFDFMAQKYKPDQTGGMAETFNNVILAGNNSSYYPHEVVHLYNKNKFQNSAHAWVDEGIAAFYGGSGGYPLDWHLSKLKDFLNEAPLFKIKDLSTLEKDIPNGEFMTDFRYAIGGLVIKNIYENEGMQGIFDMLHCGRRDDDYFALLTEKLGVNQDTLESYVRSEVRKLK